MAESSAQRLGRLGSGPQVDREAIRPGDRIKNRGRWETVVRVNKTTVSVETGYTWTDKIPPHEITDHQRTGLACQQTD